MRTPTTRTAAIAAAVALATSAPAWAADGELSLGTGINYTTGDYGTPTSTDIVSIPITARYDKDAWSFRATVPYLRISGPSSVIPGVGRVERRNRGRTGTGTVSGIGDASVSAGYTMYSGAGRSGVGLTGKLKLDTGDENEGLGTGSNDVSLQADAFQQLDGGNTVFGVVGYTIFGDSPVTDFQNVWNVGIGGSHRLNADDSVGLALDARQGATPAPLPQRELTLFWTHKMERNWRTQAYFLKGFADGSPDWGLGINATLAF